jgi:hypothetical protein
VGIIFNSDDVIDNLVNDEALVNVNAMETTEVVGDAANFVQDALEKK